MVYESDLSNPLNELSEKRKFAQTSGFLPIFIILSWNQSEIPLRTDSSIYYPHVTVIYYIGTVSPNKHQ